MKPKIFTPICRERLVNLLFRNFYIGILLFPRAGWWSWAPPATSSLEIQSQSRLLGEPSAPGVCATQPTKLQCKSSLR